MATSGGTVGQHTDGLRRHRFVTNAVRAGFALALLAVVGTPVATASPKLADRGTKSISFHNIHNREDITVVFKRDGRYVPAALEKLNWFLRDWRQDVKTRMDPKLFDLLSDIHAELGSQRPIHVISAYRSAKTNAMLRKSRGGQARKSRHMMGMAIDVHFPDVPVRKLRYSALVRQQGGVGYYPRSSIPFVHVDTGRVRHWPRMSRTELALLFPNGRTRHRPPDNKPITRRDAAIARRDNPDLAMRVAAFHDQRRSGGGIPGWSTETQFAVYTAPSLTPPAPKLVAASLPLPPVARSAPPPRLVRAPAPARVPRDDADPSRAMLKHLAALNNRVAPAPASHPTPHAASTARPKDRDVAFVRPATDMDHEHPEELHYAPFPVTPFLTQTPSPDDPSLLVLRRPDAAKSLVLLADAGQQPMTKWTFGAAYGTTYRMTQFTGRAVDIASAGLVGPAEPLALPDGRPRLAERMLASR